MPDSLKGPFYLPLYAFLFSSCMWWTGHMFLIYAVFWNKPKYLPWSEQIFPRDLGGSAAPCWTVRDLKKNVNVWTKNTSCSRSFFRCYISYTYGIYEAWNFVYSLLYLLDDSSCPAWLDVFFLNDCSLSSSSKNIYLKWTICVGYCITNQQKETRSAGDSGEAEWRNRSGGRCHLSGAFCDGAALWCSKLTQLSATTKYWLGNSAIGHFVDSFVSCTYYADLELRQ